MSVNRISPEWLTADLHIGHANIIDYCDRPFTSVEEMNESIVDRWNAVIAPGETVLVLGDVLMGKVDDGLAAAKRLNGYKILLTGNHDRCASMHTTKAEGWVQRYMDEGGFSEIYHGSIRIRLRGYRDTLCCHFPYAGDSRPEEDRFNAQRPDDKGEWLLHGHVHDTWLQKGRMLNMGIDAHGGAVLHADEVIDYLDAGPRDLESIPWPVKDYSGPLTELA